MDMGLTPKDPLPEPLGQVGPAEASPWGGLDRDLGERRAAIARLEAPPPPFVTPTSGWGGGSQSVGREVNRRRGCFVANRIGRSLGSSIGRIIGLSGSPLWLVSHEVGDRPRVRRQPQLSWSAERTVAQKRTIAIPDDRNSSFNQ